MGQVTIEIPQNVSRSFQIKDFELGEQLLDNIKEFENKAKAGNSYNDETAEPKKKLETVTLVLPYDDLDEIDENEAVGIWADREESADEIARRIRKNNRKTT